MDPLTALTFLGPIVIDAGKALISRFLAPDEFKPASIDEYVKMRELDLNMFRAMNEAGGANPSYPWVEAVVRLMRPSVAAVTILVWAYAHAYSLPDTGAIDNFAAAIGFYLFGDRTLFYSRRALEKVAK